MTNEGKTLERQAHEDLIREIQDINGPESKILSVMYPGLGLEYKRVYYTAANTCSNCLCFDYSRLEFMIFFTVDATLTFYLLCNFSESCLCLKLYEIQRNEKVSISMYWHVSLYLLCIFIQTN